MKNTPRISVIIPSFNKVNYIRKTLNSIFKQNYPNLELIIQDGGSTDGTLDIIKEFSKKHSIIWQSRKDKGQLDAINIGFRKATGEILSFINADDCYTPKAFKMISQKYLDEPNGRWFAGQGILVNRDDKEIAKWVTLYKNILLRLSSYNVLLSTNYLIQPSVFITKNTYQKYGPFTGTTNFIMEYELWLKIGRDSMPVVINEVISSFRIEPSTKTKNMSKGLLSEDWKIVNKYTDNQIVLFLHNINNIGRSIVEKFV